MSTKECRGGARMLVDGGEGMTARGTTSAQVPLVEIRMGLQMRKESDSFLQVDPSSLLLPSGTYYLEQ